MDIECEEQKEDHSISNGKESPNVLESFTDADNIGGEFFETFTDEGLLKKKPILTDTSGKTSIFRGWGG